MSEMFFSVWLAVLVVMEEEDLREKKKKKNGGLDTTFMF